MEPRSEERRSINAPPEGDGRIGQIARIHSIPTMPPDSKRTVVPIQGWDGTANNDKVRRLAMGEQDARLLSEQPSGNRFSRGLPTEWGLTQIFQRDAPGSHRNGWGRRGCGLAQGGGVRQIVKSLGEE